MKIVMVLGMVVTKIFLFGLFGEKITNLVRNSLLILLNKNNFFFKTKNIYIQDKEIADEVYSTQWFFESKKIVNAKILVIRKCQKSLKISVAGIVHHLGLPFFSHASI